MQLLKEQRRTSSERSGRDGQASLLLERLVVSRVIEARDMTLVCSLDSPLVFLGEKLVNFLVEPKKGTKWPKDLPKFQSRTQAIAVCKDLCKYGFVHRSEKRGKGVLVVSAVAYNVHY